MGAPRPPSSTPPRFSSLATMTPLPEIIGKVLCFPLQASAPGRLPPPTRRLQGPCPLRSAPDPNQGGCAHISAPLQPGLAQAWGDEMSSLDRTWTSPRAWTKIIDFGAPQFFSVLYGPAGGLPSLSPLPQPPTGRPFPPTLPPPPALLSPLPLPVLSLTFHLWSLGFIHLSSLCFCPQLLLRHAPLFALLLPPFLSDSHPLSPATMFRPYLGLDPPFLPTGFPHVPGDFRELSPSPAPSSLLFGLLLAACPSCRLGSFLPRPVLPIFWRVCFACLP